MKTNKTDAERQRVLVIDDEEVVRISCKRILEPEGYEVQLLAGPEEAFKILGQKPFDLVLTDLKMPGIGGIEILKRVKEDYPDTEVIIITGYGTVDTAVSAMKLGAYDYIEKPFTPETLSAVVRRAIERRQLLFENLQLKRELSTRYIRNIVGSSKAMEMVFQLIAYVAPTGSTVLITGETGTGKELVARAIHYNSPRKDQPFVVVDCGTIPDNLIESELFGYTKGSFTGAVADKKGLIEEATAGTLFLDEVGNIGPSTQAKLLRVLQEKEFRPIGSKKSIKVDIRFIAATNKDLKAMTEKGLFREDLFYRLNIFPIHIPLLRDRKEDIPILANHFLKKYSNELDKPSVSRISAEAMRLLLSHDWPGNVRELESSIQRAILLCTGKTIEIEHLSFIQPPKSLATIPQNSEELRQVKKNLRHRSIEEIERAFIIEALRRNNWNITHAARDVGMQRTNFQALVKKYRITQDCS